MLKHYSLPIIFFLAVFSCYSCRPVVKNVVQRNACTEGAINAMVDECGVGIPNIFSPNGDGINDVFGLVTSCDLEVFRMTIKDGKQDIFFTDDVNQAFWDGTFEGEVYLGFLRYEISGLFSGSNTPFSFLGNVASVPYDFNGVSNLDTYRLENCKYCIFADQLPLDRDLSLLTNENMVILCAE